MQSVSGSHPSSVGCRNRRVLLRRPGRHVMRQEVRKPAHEAHPGPEGREPEQRRTQPRHDEHREGTRSEEHTSELQSRLHLVCRLLLEKKKKKESKHTRRRI